MIRTLIIDDEEPARMLVRKFLEDFSEIEVLGECADGFTAVKSINEHNPDLIFLDVQMPKLSGFELLEIIEHKPHVIFTTAYDSYAIKAFDENAVDYLLKPFSRERFADAVKKVVGRIASQTEQNFTEVIALAEEKTEILQRIAVKSGSKIEIIAIGDIVYLESEGDYVMIHTKEGKFLKEKTMKYFEQHLDPDTFIRIHRSYIININEISRIELFEKENYIVKLKNGDQVKASSSGYKALKDALKL
ncbi:LytR/AlgR family response regulator transcription factor [Acetobacteroides hydrogenigenes]|uniref:Two-component system LytT family response regulator n=1 Tax=Acetobacteroides hydrogenigenes TaxID=979970 RepID=A0A4R2ERI4_9BACT|nr:LytTR family transcriptional regulator DNA-binding domain-containing protein [Acetobacteroides hydrogenigenes]TCN70206.1 two-component system LytT family response regulator [Acetobacteroides hydrogenigenes]